MSHLSSGILHFKTFYFYMRPYFCAISIIFTSVFFVVIGWFFMLIYMELNLFHVNTSQRTFILFFIQNSFFFNKIYFESCFFIHYDNLSLTDAFKPWTFKAIISTRWLCHICYCFISSFLFCLLLFHTCDLSLWFYSLCFVSLLFSLLPFICC